MKKALVLEPTPEEFSAGPLAYIERHRGAIESAGGLCVIRPPPAIWQPSCVIDPSTYTIRAPIQRIGAARQQSIKNQMPLEIKTETTEVDEKMKCEVIGKDEGRSKTRAGERTSNRVTDEGNNPIKIEDKYPVVEEDGPKVMSEIPQGTRSRGRGRKVAVVKVQRLESVPVRKPGRGRGGRRGCHRIAHFENADAITTDVNEAAINITVESDRVMKERNSWRKNEMVEKDAKEVVRSDEFRLNALGEMAAAFKTAHFWRPTNRVRDEDVEAEFWRLMANQDAVEVIT